ncbi:MAG: PilZ domain-containing protein [Methylobacterium sp.]
MAAIDPSAGDDSERRVAPRVRTLKRAQILFNNRFSTLDCVVRNISATGALLTIDAAAPLPRTFEIRVGDEEAIRPAKLVYRRELFAGIHFLDVPDDGESAAPLPQAHDSVENFDAQAATAVLRIVPAPLPRALVARFSWF